MTAKILRQTRVIHDPVDMKANFLAFLAEGPAGERAPLYAGPMPQAGASLFVGHSTTIQMGTTGATASCTCGWTQHWVASDGSAHEAAYAHRVRAIRSQGTWRAEA